MMLAVPRMLFCLYTYLVVSIFTGLSVLSGSLPCSAQTVPGTSGARTEKVRRFNEALQQVANKDGLVIVAEGIPLIESITESHYARITEGASEIDALSALAAAFDYDCIRRRPRLYVLVKRYSDPRDLPGVLPEELRAALKDILRLLEPYDPMIGTPGNLARDVFAALTPEEIAAMKRGELTVASLRAEQQAVFRKAVNYFSVGFTAMSFRSGEEWLGQALTGSLCYGIDQGKEMFGYRFPDPTPQSDQKQFRGLGPKVGEPEITTVPKVEAITWAARFNNAETVGVLCERLSLEGGVTFEAKPELKDKPITVIQGTGSTRAPDAILAAVADAYGLHLERTATHGTLRRPRPLIVKDQSELGGAVRALIPAPIRHALRIREVDPKTKPFSTGLSNNRKFETDTPRYTEYEIDENIRLLGREALRFLTITFNEGMHHRAEKGISRQEIPLLELDRFSHAALTAIFSFEPFASAGPFLTSPEIPRFVTEFDSLIISGDQFQEGGKPMISFHLMLRNPLTGRLFRYAGVPAAPAIDPAVTAKGKP